MLAVYKTERDFWKALFFSSSAQKKPVACSLKVEREDILTLLVRTVSTNIFSDISVQIGTSAGLQIVEVCRDIDILKACECLPLNSTMPLLNHQDQ